MDERNLGCSPIISFIPVAPRFGDIKLLASCSHSLAF